MKTFHTAPKRRSLHLTVDYRHITFALVAIIVVLIGIWQPWAAKFDPHARTIEVTGETKLSAIPDEYVFYPMYQFQAANKADALKELSAKSDEVVKKLESLGVPASKIAINSNGYDSPAFIEPAKEGITYSLNLTITVSEKALAQKVQDYLVTTEPVGAISPQANFSEAKRSELEAKARDAATRDARKKAEQSAHNLGFRISAVKSVTDGSGFNNIYPLESGNSASDATLTTPKLTVQPGENDLTYRVTVVYYIN